METRPAPRDPRRRRRRDAGDRADSGPRRPTAEARLRMPRRQSLSRPIECIPAIEGETPQAIVDVLVPSSTSRPRHNRTFGGALRSSEASRQPMSLPAGVGWAGTRPVVR